ncbi:hypothetical protein D3C71_1627790 [compost metagenome]
MPAWSNISCAQWIGLLRAPSTPFSYRGVRPAVKNIGTWLRAAFIRPQTALAAPTVTCSITAWGLPVTM